MWRGLVTRDPKGGSLGTSEYSVNQESPRAPSGRLVVSDTVAECTLKVDSKDLNAWTECVAGALPEDEYIDLIKKTGFVDIEVRGKTQSCCSQGIASITVTATAPKNAED